MNSDHDWWNNVDRNHFLKSLYTDCPSLESFELFEVRFDGEVCSLRGDLGRYADHPPAKWLVSHSNTVQITFGLYGIESCELSGWAMANAVRLVIERAKDGALTVEAVGQTCRLKAKCARVDVARVGEYQKVAETPQAPQ